MHLSPIKSKAYFASNIYTFFITEFPTKSENNLSQATALRELCNKSCLETNTENNLVTIRPFGMQKPCTKLKVNKHCDCLAGFVYLKFGTRFLRVEKPYKLLTKVCRKNTVTKTKALVEIFVGILAKTLASASLHRTATSSTEYLLVHKQIYANRISNYV